MVHFPQELNAEHLAAGTSRALDAVIHVATAAALQEERQASQFSRGKTLRAFPPLSLSLVVCLVNASLL